MTAGAERVVRAQEGWGTSVARFAGFGSLQEGLMEVK
jgi:hypothetical protein